MSGLKARRATRATTSDLFIYYAPSGSDACAEMGAAWAAGVHIIGLYARGEHLGLMRKMASAWYTSLVELFVAIEKFNIKLNQALPL
jgi:hypothetical protein